MNSFIHVIMYGYYTLALLGISCPWKKWITNCQMLQFMACLAHSCYVAYKGNLPIQLPAAQGFFDFDFLKTNIPIALRIVTCCPWHSHLSIFSCFIAISPLFDGYDSSLFVFVADFSLHTVLLACHLFCPFMIMMMLLMVIKVS